MLDIMWTSWLRYEKVEINGHIYAKVGERLYSRHAVNRMYPSGNRFKTERPRIGTVDFYTAEEGRSISPTFIEDIIRNVKPKFQPNTGNYLYTDKNVQVVLNDEGDKGAVVTIMTYSNPPRR
ncbi:MAG: hypothetical protein FWG65_07830 [Turicibacter sp.]|nr:hypothetical protein [Turicibacter sp.]